MSETSQETATHKQDKQEAWFEMLINNISVDRLQLQTNTASEDKEHFYDSMINGDPTEVVASMRRKSSQFFIARLVRAYITEIEKRSVAFAQIAFDLSDAKVLVWAVITDDDEAAEDGLILAEAKVNADFSGYGFHISTTIVEESDNLDIPSHYIPLEDKSEVV